MSWIFHAPTLHRDAVPRREDLNTSTCWNQPVNPRFSPTLSVEQRALRATLTLCLIPGVGPRTRQTLFERFPTAEAILSASPEQLRQVPGIGSQLCTRITSARQQIDVEREIRICQQHDIGILTQADPGYPRLLQRDPRSARSLVLAR